MVITSLEIYRSVGAAGLAFLAWESLLLLIPALLVRLQEARYHRSLL